MTTIRTITAAILLFVTSCAFAEPYDFQANLRSLAKNKHPWLAAEIALANRTDKIYGDIGQFDVIAWTATGERKYLDDAVPKLLATLTIDPLPPANTVREYFAELAMLYRWIRPSLTPEQNAEFEKRFNRWCEFCCAVNTAKYQGGWNYADSDLTTGQYLGLLICDQTFGWKWTERDDAKKARESIRRYCEQSAGGEWLESGAYNLGTLQFLLIGAYAAGIENFPEVEKLVPEIVEQELGKLTPDFKSAYQWGDEENPRELHVHRRVALFGILHGLTGDERLLKAMDAILAGKTFKDYANLSWRAVYFARVPEPEPTPANQYLRVSEGNGHFRYKRDGSMLCVHFPKRLGVHHEVSYVADIQWYLDGEWVLTRPLGYAGASITGEAGNSPLMAGISSFLNRGPSKWQESAGGCVIAGGTSGPYPYEAAYYKPPGAFAEHFRKVVFQFPDKLIISDSFKGAKPTDTAKYRESERVIINGSPLWQQVWHCPVEPTKTETGFIWKTTGGKTVTLTAPKNCKSVVIDEREKWAANKTNFKASELKWQIRFVSDELVCEMVTTLEVE
jgi:hypothetical protein